MNNGNNNNNDNVKILKEDEDVKNRAAEGKWTDESGKSSPVSKGKENVNIGTSDHKKEMTKREANEPGGEENALGATNHNEDKPDLDQYGSQPVKDYDKP